MAYLSDVLYLKNDVAVLSQQRRQIGRYNDDVTVRVKQKQRLHA